MSLPSSSGSTRRRWGKLRRLLRLRQGRLHRVRPRLHRVLQLPRRLQELAWTRPGCPLRRLLVVPDRLRRFRSGTRSPRHLHGRHSRPRSPRRLALAGAYSALEIFKNSDVSRRSTDELSAARFFLFDSRAVSSSRFEWSRYARRRSVNAARHRRTLRNAAALHAHFALVESRRTV